MTAVRLPDTPTLNAVAMDIMRAQFAVSRDQAPNEWRVDGDQYDAIESELTAFRQALGLPVLFTNAGHLMVCGISLVPIGPV